MPTMPSHHSCKLYLQTSQYDPSFLKRKLDFDNNKKVQILLKAWIILSSLYFPGMHQIMNKRDKTLRYKYTTQNKRKKPKNMFLLFLRALYKIRYLQVHRNK